MASTPCISGVDRSTTVTSGCSWCASCAHAGAQERVVVSEQQAHVDNNAGRRAELAYAGTARRQGARRRSALRIARVAGERLSV